MKVVSIDWVDSCSLDSGYWKDKESVVNLEPSECHTVGIIMKENKDYVTVASSTSKYQSGGELCIPRVAIKKMRVLRDSKT